LKFINGQDSPSGRSLLVVAHEISGTTAVYEIEATVNMLLPMVIGSPQQ
jgi:hypothetical protein